MRPDHHQRVAELFAEVCDLSPDERTEVLDEKCAGEPELRKEIESLLAQEQASSREVDTNQAIGARVLSDDPSVAGPIPERIGPYRILQKLAEGGMGVVYEAEQETPVRRRVALKIVKWGMDTKQVIARFEAERQALALMNHPNVAKVFDAGATEQGRPYFVMELVKGVPITEHCDRHRFTTEERLRLFMQACEGVQHAHQKGIIHRDLKPSNILVSVEDEKAVPKIIDFGVARATEQRLTERTLFTELGQIIGTPEYMSPEQAEMTGQDIDTRTDVYSLGAVFYELLVGALPFDPKELRDAGFDEIRRRIREEEPSRPSTKVSTLGDLSTDSANKRRTDARSLSRQLRGDLDWITLKALDKDRTRRYGSPAELAADVGRHLDARPVVASPPSASYRLSKFCRRHRTALITSIVLASILAISIGDEVSDYLALQVGRRYMQEVRGFFPEVAEWLKADGKDLDTPMKEVLESASRYAVETFEDSPPVEWEFHNSMLKVYREFEHWPGAIRALKRLVEIEKAAGRNYEYEVLTLADTYRKASQLANAEQVLVSFGDSLKDDFEWQALYARVLADQDKKNEAHRRADDAIQHMDDSIFGREQLVMALQALERYEEADSVIEATVLLDPENPFLYERQGVGFRYLNRLDEAIPTLQKAVSLANDRPWGHQNLGQVYDALGEYELAIRSYELALEIDPTDTWTWNQLAVSWSHNRDFDKEVECLESSLRLESSAFAYYLLGQALRRVGRFNEAETSHLKALNIDPEYYWAHLGIARVKASQGLYREAIREFRRAVDLNSEAWWSWEDLAYMHLSQGDESGAVETLSAAVGTFPSIRKMNSYVQTLLALGQLDDAEAALQEVDRDGVDEFKAAVNRARLDFLLSRDESIPGHVDHLASAGCDQFDKKFERRQCEVSLALVFGYHGKPEASLERLRQAEALGALPYDRACILAVNDQKERALLFLEEALAYGDIWPGWARHNTDLTHLHGNSEFEAIVAEAGGGRVADKRLW